MIVCLAGLGMGSAAYGQGRQTGVLEGSVVAFDGRPAPGVPVTLSGEALVRGEARTLSGATGRFRFPELPPGSYTLLAERADGASAVELDVAVTLGGRREVMLRLLPRAPEQVVEVVAERPTVEASRLGLSNEYGRQMFDDLPGTRRGFDDLVQLAPGVTRHRIPALESGRPVIQGGSWLDNQILIDGVNYADPISNSVLTRFDFFALEAVEVQTGGFAAEYGQVMGGVLNMLTRSGGNQHELAARAVASPGTLAAGPGATRYELNLRAGGPVVRQRLWYFTSASYAYDFEPIVAHSNARLAEGTIVHSPIVFTKLKWEPAPSHQITAHLTESLSLQRNNPHLFAEPEAQGRSDIGALTGQLAWKWLGDSTVLALSVNGTYREALNGPMSGDVDTPGHFDRQSGVFSVNGVDISHYRSTRLAVQGSWTRFVEALGRHELKTGFEVATASVLFEQAAPGNEALLDAGGRCIPEQGRFEGCEAAVRTGTEGPGGKLQPGLFATRGHGLEVGGFVQDVWTLGWGVRLQPGWRIDLGRIDGSDGQRVASFNALGGPRLAVSWDVCEHGTTVLRASAGRYQQTGVLALPLFFGPSLRQETWRFNPQTRQFDIFERASGGNTGAVSDPAKATRPPTSLELIAGVEQALAKGLAVRVSGIYKKLENLYNSIETNLVWNETGSSVVGFRDGTPQPRYSLYTGPEFFREYAALELALAGQLSTRTQVVASYTLSRLQGTSDLDELTDADNIAPTVVANPRQRPFLYGPLWGDHRHAAKLAMTWRHPAWGVSFGSVLSIVTGGPYSRLYYNAQIAQYVDRRAARGIDPGNLSNPDDDRVLRLPVTIDWSVRAACSLARWVGGPMEAELNIQNLLDRRAVQQVIQANVPAGQPGAFGTPLDFQRPLAVTLGLSYRY